VRIRSVKPDFWRDRLMAELPAEGRLFYIGLWMEADDAGWLRWQPDEIAADLYPYRAIRTRERHAREWGARLVDMGRLVLHPCGHGFIPKLTKHQLSQGGSKSRYVLGEHALCKPESGGVRSDTDNYGREVREGEVKEGEGSREPINEAASDVLPNISDPNLRERLLRKAAGE
jgi:hypothetical protein